MTKKITAALLALALVLSGVVYMPGAAKADGADSVYYDTTGDFSIADYWSAAEKKVPVKAGYVFGGWFERGSGDSYTPILEENLSDATVASVTAYAKFVPADVLSVKTQVAPEPADSSKVAMRLLSTTDSADYQKVGFQYQLGNRAAGEKEMTKIYRAIRPSKSSTEVLYPADSFVAASGYFIALDVRNIVSSSFASIVSARAFWVTLDGTKVLGLARDNRVEDNQNGSVSAGVNLLTDGLADNGVAAGKVVLTYNTADYDVLTAGSAPQIDNGRIFPQDEMEWAVNEAAGTITFVGNAETVNTDVAADGMLASIRFVKSGSGDLGLAVTEASFYNWNEEAVSVVAR